MNQISKDLIDRISKGMELSGVPGLSIGLVNANGIVWSKNFGFADKENGLETDNDTLFRIGSITKVFTATAIMQLAESKKLDIHDPVDKYIPEFCIKSRFGKKIIIKDLMTHHSGVPSDDFQSYFSDDPNAYKSVIPYLKDNYAAYPPNYIFSYSNLGINLLGIIIERVSGMNYQDYIKKKVLDILDMKSSALYMNDVDIPKLAKGYLNNTGAYEPSLKYAPAGAVISSVEDMSHFIMFILNNGRYSDKNILDSKTLNDMFVPQNENVSLDFDFRIGLCWILSRSSLSNTGKVVWHDGGTPSYSSIIVILPDKDLGIIILSNGANGGALVHDIADRILLSYLGENPAEPAKQTYGSEQIIGDYATLKGLFSVKQEDKLFLRMQGKKFILNKINGRYSVEELPGCLFSARNINSEKVLVIEQIQGLNKITSALGKSYTKPKNNFSWKNYLGCYKCINTDAQIQEIELCDHDNSLSIKFSARKVGDLNLIINPLNDHEATILGLGRFAGETIKIEDGLISLYGLTFKK